MPSYTPAAKDQKGYHLSPRSTCCNALVVRFDSVSWLWVFWEGHGEPPNELRCHRCNRKLTTELDESE